MPMRAMRTPSPAPNRTGSTCRASSERAGRSAMRLLPAGQHRRMPWKNGGGETTEIAVAPEGAGLDALDWRVSMARVATDGPFSAFPSIDRTLSVLAGVGIALAIAGRPEI